jgi:hypothetical protein
MKPIYLYLIIVGLGLYSVFTTYKIISDKPKIVTNTVVVPGDIRYRDTIVYQPKPYKVIIHDTVDRYVPKDSAQCVSDYRKLYAQYSATKQYKNILQNDTSMTVEVSSTIFENGLQDISLKSKNNRPTSISTTTVTYSNKLPMLSLGAMYDMKSLITYGVLRVNSNLYLTGGYNISIKTPVLGIQYTIFSK